MNGAAPIYLPIFS